MSISELCEHIDDARDLRLSLLAQLRQLVPFDSFAWLLTDPTSEVGVAPIADVPCLPELPRLIRLKYATELNRWTHQPEPIARLHSATGGRLEQSLVWRELLADHHVSDIASIVFRDRFGCWAFLDLWRSAGVFTDEHARVVAGHVPAITAALRRCTLQTFSRPTDARDRHPWTGPVVLVLTDQLEVQGQTPETERYLRALVPPDGDRQPVPAGAYNVAAQLLATEAGIDDHPPTARVHLHGGEWLMFRAARIGADIAVSIERASPMERLDLFRRSAGLTARETELLDVLATGADTRAIAKHLFVSEHTVQDHLKAIFAKTGTTSRRELLARATTL
jgi:DNA-binding CsgD family transcriptional regulator